MTVIALPSNYADQVKHLRHAAYVLDTLKTERGCTDCGFNSWPESLHFDHVNPATKLAALGWVSDRSRLTTRSKLARFLAHVDQYCEVRCANCHAHRTSVEKHWRPRAAAGEQVFMEGLF